MEKLLESTLVPLSNSWKQCDDWHGGFKLCKALCGEKNAKACDEGIVASYGKNPITTPTEKVC